MKDNRRFFCDNCGSEVPQDAEACPKCERSFVSVRCPACGLTGEMAIFSNGCPNCGYAVQPAVKTKSLPFKNKMLPKKKTLKQRQLLLIDALPIWVYVVTGAMVLGVFVVLYFSLI